MNSPVHRRTSDAGSRNGRPLHFTDQSSADEVARLLNRSARAPGAARPEKNASSQTAKEPAFHVGITNRIGISDHGAGLLLSKTF